MYRKILILWIKGCQFFRNHMCDATNHKSYGSGLTAVTEVHKRIVYILNNIIVFNWLLYNILWLVGIWCIQKIPYQYLEIFSSCWCWILYINMYVHYKLITDCYVLFPQFCFEGGGFQFITHLFAWGDALCQWCGSVSVYVCST